METLVVLEEYRSQEYGRANSYGTGRFRSSPSKGFREINCRSFQSGVGVLPSPYRSYSTPVTKRASPSSSPRSLSPSAISTSVDESPLKTCSKSKPVLITSNVRKNEKASDEGLVEESGSFSYSELWAGPTYSNSPPPSSVPIPKFSLRSKRTVSLDLPAPKLSVEIHPTAKSAPASPTREHNPRAKDLFLSADSATKTLRRILNLDVADE